MYLKNGEIGRQINKNEKIMNLNFQLRSRSKFKKEEGFSLVKKRRV